MPRFLNRNYFSLLSPNISSAASTYAYGIVEKEKAQIITPKKTVSGFISKITKIESTLRIVLDLRRNKQMLVHLGEQWNSFNEKLTLSIGDRISVTGPVIMSGNHAAIVGKSIKKGKQHIVKLCG